MCAMQKKTKSESHSFSSFFIEERVLFEEIESARYGCKYKQRRSCLTQMSARNKRQIFFYCHDECRTKKTTLLKLQEDNKKMNVKNKSAMIFSCCCCFKLTNIEVFKPCALYQFGESMFCASLFSRLVKSELLNAKSYKSAL